MCVRLIIRQILTTKPSEVLLVQRNDMIQQLAASTADPSCSDSILPRAPQTRSYRLNAARPQKAENLSTELCVAIKQDVTIGAGKRQSLAQLLDNPVGGRIFGAVEVQNSSSAVFNDKERVESSKVQRGNRKEVEGSDDLAVVVQKRQPSFRLALVISAPDASKVARNRGLGNAEAELEQFAVNARSSPAWIVCFHAPNEFVYFTGHASAVMQ